MVLGEAAPSEHLAAPAPGLDPGARGVHEHDVERGEQIAPAGEQLLLQTPFTQRGENGVAPSCWSSQAPRPATPSCDKDDAARSRRRRRCGSPRTQRSAARSEPPADETVQHGQERRAPQREVMAARSRQALIKTLAAPVNGAAIIPQKWRRKIPQLAGRRSAVGVIGASVFWRAAATLQGRRNGSGRGIRLEADVFGQEVGVLAQPIA